MLAYSLALAAFLFPLAYSPGPGNLFFAANGARFGLRATLPANLGYHLATWIVTLLIGLGFSTALAAMPVVFSVIKLAGAGYVLWIAVGLMRSDRGPDAAEARPAGFRDGAVLLLLNPKAYVIITLMFTQFLAATPLPWLGAVLLITTLFTLNNAVAFLTWTVAGDWLAARLRRHDRAHRLNIVFGLLLAGVAIWMAFA